MEVLLVLVLLLVSVEHSECVRCFARFDLNSGRCNEELGEVDEDDCCQNPHYGYETTDGACQSCGPPTWSSWSSWSQCTVLCGDGVRQRRRTCYGIGESECELPKDKLQTEVCSGVCCDAEGWGLWLAWSPCSVTCGGGGVRKRVRECASSPECRSACTGPSEETENCPTQNPCPVHGGWSSWSDWSQCSGSCIDDQRSDVPSKQRHRSCTKPVPSSDTVPHGDSCPGDGVQVVSCSELPNCPVDGNWGPWAPPGPCTVTCGEGLRVSLRTCNNPTPKYGGRFCDGSNAQTSVCQSPCPVDGFWSGWSSWGECSGSCIPQSSIPTRTRHRSCNNPVPSSSPPGRACSGDNQQKENCNHLPYCAVDGVWSSWSPFTPCPVTCGVGPQVSVRRCDGPAPSHGGRPCPGEGRRISICTTSVHCPVDGVWSQWTTWKPCKFPFGKREINCRQLGGLQTRERECLHRAHNGTICSGDSLTDRRVCYDVDKCYMKGTWEGWEQWSLCNPSCGANTKRVRKRICKPDYSGYSSTIGRQKEIATFFGTPRADCGNLPEGEKKYEVESCVNVPPCT
ncbi:properdin [Anabas testudineus]|uniref:Complement factor properdin n=1 Tax=Anabas testudineus TaxID=64144 RepID=A0A3Q1IRU7_ANATE|nr:properdin [Anabas testudineus]